MNFVHESDYGIGMYILTDKMKPDEENGYTQNIGEWVLDEDKIVTYKWLSKTLCVHINTAKQLLFAYLSEQRNKSPSKVSGTYLLAGRSKDGNHSVTVVNEDELETRRTDFQEITAEHVYSVQKIQSVKDFQILYRANKSASDFEGMIKCSKSFLRTKNDSLASPRQETGKPVDGLSKDQNKIKVSNETRKTNDPSKGAENPKKSGPASAERENPKERKSGVNAKKGGNIASFFGNAGASKKSKPEEEIGTGIGGAEETIVTETEKKIRPSKSIPENEAKSKSQPEPASKKKKKVDDEGKKRKRIKVFTDSEDSGTESTKERSPSPMNVDEAYAEGEPETEIPVGQDDKTVEVHKESVQNKRKKRKVVDRTVMSEDGYIETKKEVVYETDSENEEKLPEKGKAEQTENASKRTSPRKKGKAPAENSNPKQAANSKKQSSLYSFFKKN